MKRVLIFLAVVGASGCEASPPEWRPADLALPTRWSSEVSPDHARPEYPRPAMRRDAWLSLNGLWDYAIAARGTTAPEAWEGRILVPFPVESSLSGVADTVGSERRLWYRRTFVLPAAWAGQRVLLHFEAADWETVVWVNGEEAGSHRGGFDPFSFDITPYLLDSGPQEVRVAVWDPTDSGTQPRGKQVREPGGIFYTSVTGIWGTVWLEPVPGASIDRYDASPDPGTGVIRLRVDANRAGAADDRPLEAEFTVLAQGHPVATGRAPAGAEISLPIHAPRLWTPADPFLYELDVRLLANGEPVDSVHGEFGMRQVSIGPDSRGMTRLLLNGEPMFQVGTLDQGWWPDGLYTAPTEEALVHDLEMTRVMGFNMLRKHVKVEPRTFYSWCDRMGILVWQDMPSASIPLTNSGSDETTDPAAAEQFEHELAAMIRSLRNHPSIVMWVPFNEGWGQYDSDRIVALVRELDGTRPVNQASGWNDMGGGDVLDRHHYPPPEPPDPEVHRAAVQGEFGGLGFNVPGHTWRETGWGYDLFPDVESLATEYEAFMNTIREAAAGRGLSASIYTQITDVETENNGLLTYDREIAKMDSAWVRKANRGYLPPVVDRAAPIFLDAALIRLREPAGAIPGALIRYTLDGSEPTADSPAYEDPIEIAETTDIRVRSWWTDGTASRTATFRATRAVPEPSVSVDSVARAGLVVDVFDHDGSWRELPDFVGLSADETLTVDRVLADVAGRTERYALRFTGFVRAPETGVYAFHLTSDDGSRLMVGELELDNDGIHGMETRTAWIALQAGWHPIDLEFFQGAGGVGLRLEMEGPGFPRAEIPASLLSH
ncbi:MAG: glycoside hydrolase family 2 TIM barrel-domain containing protein [Candidatus Palauibacterales bacterium]|nr:glycoside hydrolase family 2 TIM barrel-domain containing protein [Candidatus Palauibacterales bacterium]